MGCAHRTSCDISLDAPLYRHVFSDEEWSLHSTKDPIDSARPRPHPTCHPSHRKPACAQAVLHSSSHRNIILPLHTSLHHPSPLCYSHSTYLSKPQRQRACRTSQTYLYIELATDQGRVVCREHAPPNLHSLVICIHILPPCLHLSSAPSPLHFISSAPIRLCPLAPPLLRHPS